MNNLETLRGKQLKLNSQIYRAEKEELEKRVLPKVRELIGKCYKYLNSYGGNQPSWWLYQIITGIDHVIDENKVWVLVNAFQRDCHGNIQFKKKEWSWRELDSRTSWEEIPKSEFQKEKRKLLKILENF